MANELSPWFGYDTLIDEPLGFKLKSLYIAFYM